MAANEANNTDDLRRQLADPQALAVQQRFLAEWRAGRRPRLSVYARRYPAYATALADLVATLPPDALNDDIAQATAEAANAALAAVPGRTPSESFPGRPAFNDDNDLAAGHDAGVDRALATIFGATTPDAAAGERSLPQVAERAADYHTTPSEPSEATNAPAGPAQPAQQPQSPAPPERD